MTESESKDQMIGALRFQRAFMAEWNKLHDETILAHAHTVIKLMSKANEQVEFEINYKKPEKKTIVPDKTELIINPEI